MNFICLNLRQWQKEVGHHAPGLNESELQLSWVESASCFFVVFFLYSGPLERMERQRESGGRENVEKGVKGALIKHACCMPVLV